MNISCAGIELPQEQPAVSFDIRLGQSIPAGMQLSFDDHLYRRLLVHMAPDDPDAWQHARVMVAKPGKGQMRAGNYNPDEELVTVMYTNDTDTDNETLVHESRHFLDHRSGSYNPDSLIYPAGWIARAAGPLGAVVLFGVEAVAQPANHWAALAALGCTACYIAGSLCYSLSRVERRAYGSQRYYGPIPIIGLKERATSAAPV